MEAQFRKLTEETKYLAGHITISLEVMAKTLGTDLSACRDLAAGRRRGIRRFVKERDLKLQAGDVADSLGRLLERLRVDNEIGEEGSIADKHWQKEVGAVGRLMYNIHAQILDLAVTGEKQEKFLGVKIQVLTSKLVADWEQTHRNWAQLGAVRAATRGV